MSNKTVLGIVTVFIIAGVATLVYIFNVSVPVTAPTAGTVSTKVTVPTTGAGISLNTGGTKAGGYSPAEVAKHNSASNCWTIISGNVYDITSYIPSHPGGRNIVSACGIDSTAAFNSVRAHRNGGPLLSSMLIGPLK